MEDSRRIKNHANIRTLGAPIRAPLSFVALSFIAGGCASPLESRFQEYMERLNQTHDSQLFDPDRTPIADRLGSERYRAAFTAKVCRELEPEACEKELFTVAFHQFQDKYYAAENGRLFQTCLNDPVDCTLETWERAAVASHNEGIQWHRGQAIAGLEAWRAGAEGNPQQARMIRQWITQPVQGATLPGQRAP